MFQKWSSSSTLHKANIVAKKEQSKQLVDLETISKRKQKEVDTDEKLL